MKIHKVKVNDTMRIFQDNLLKLSGFKKLNERLKKDTLKVGDTQNHSTNVKASMTPWQMVNNHKSYQELLRIVISKLTFYKNVKLINKDYVDFSCDSMWGAVYEKGHFTQSHNHPSVFSFTYYVKAEKRCAPLIFTKPGHKKFQPKTGDLYIWKSDYFHEVPPQKINTQRIVIAGNLSYYFGEPVKSL